MLTQGLVLLLSALTFASDVDEVVLVPTVEGTTPRLFHGPFGADACFSPDDQRLLTSGNGLRVWDANSGELLNELNQLSNGWVSDARFISNDRIVAVFSPSGGFNLPSHIDQRYLVIDTPLRLCVFNLETQVMEVCIAIPFGAECGRCALSVSDVGRDFWVTSYARRNESSVLKGVHFELREASTVKWAGEPFTIPVELPNGVISSFTDKPNEIWLSDRSVTLAVDLQNLQMKWRAEHPEKYGIPFRWRYVPNDGVGILYNPAYHPGVGGMIRIADGHGGVREVNAGGMLEQGDQRLILSADSWLTLKGKVVTLERSRQTVKTWRLPFPAKLLETSPSGKKCVLYSGSRFCVLGDDGEIVSGGQQPSVHCGAAVATEDEILIAKGGDKFLTLRSISPRGRAEQDSFATTGCNSCRLSSDGKQLLWVDDGGKIYVSNVGQRPLRIPNNPSASNPLPAVTFLDNSGSSVVSIQQNLDDRVLSVTLKVWRKEGLDWQEESRSKIDAVSFSLSPQGVFVCPSEEPLQGANLLESTLQTDSLKGKGLSPVSLRIDQYGAGGPLFVPGHGLNREKLSSYAVSGPAQKLAVLSNLGRLQVLNFSGDILNVRPLRPGFDPVCTFSSCGEYLICHDELHGQVEILLVNSLRSVFQTRTTCALAGVEVVASSPPRCIVFSEDGSLIDAVLALK